MQASQRGRRCRSGGRAGGCGFGGIVWTIDVSLLARGRDLADHTIVRVEGYLVVVMMMLEK